MTLVIAEQSSFLRTSFAWSWWKFNIEVTFDAPDIDGVT